MCVFALNLNAAVTWYWNEFNIKWVGEFKMSEEISFGFERGTTGEDEIAKQKRMSDGKIILRHQKRI